MSGSTQVIKPSRPIHHFLPMEKKSFLEKSWTPQASIGILRQLHAIQKFLFLTSRQASRLICQLTLPMMAGPHGHPMVVSSSRPTDTASLRAVHFFSSTQTAQA